MRKLLLLLDRKVSRIGYCASSIHQTAHFPLDSGIPNDRFASSALPMLGLLPVISPTDSRPSTLHPRARTGYAVTSRLIGTDRATAAVYRQRTRATT